MNTSQLKTFAQKARNIIRDGVSRQLKYWGFDEKGNVECRPEKVEGGIVHREKIIDDPSVMKRWETLNHAVKHQGFDQVVEEAAYTWFNRMMAIRILSKNGYDIPQLEYGADGAQTPLILQRARRGQFTFLNKEEQTRLKLVLTDYSKDTQAFAILLTGYCHSHSLLNSIFGRLDDYTELLLPVDMLNENGFIHFLNTTLAISDEDYRQVELIGWLYQFYISEKKDQVFAQFKKNQKAEAKDIPAATQIFTPNWIVKYMVENTVGKIWLDQHPDSPIRATMKYLVESSNNSVIASDAKQSLINEVHDLKLLDPAAGSGHILVEGFELLFQMYLEEYYMPEEAVESILKNNLFGLDIDLRAAQLARFAILMKAAAKYPEILQKNILPKVFAMPAPTNFSRQEILDFLGSEGRQYEEKLGEALQLMQQAQNLGSTMQFDFTEPERIFLLKRLNELRNKPFRNNLEEALLHKIEPYLEVLAILIIRYEAIAANPPYMGRNNFNPELIKWVDTYYQKSSLDLYSVFLERSLTLVVDEGYVAMINQQTWLTIGRFTKFRKHLIERTSIDSLLHFGRGIFGSDSGTMAFALRLSKINTQDGIYRRLFIKKGNVDSVEVKKKWFLDSNFNYYKTNQTNFLKVPDNAIAYWISNKIISTFDRFSKLSSVTTTREGLATANNEYFLKHWHEVLPKKVGINFSNKVGALNRKAKWFPYHKGGDFRKWYGNHFFLVNWENDGEEIKSYKDEKTGRIRSHNYNGDYAFQKGFTWSSYTTSPISVRFCDGNFLFDSKGSMAFVDDRKLYFIISLLNSVVGGKYLEILSGTKDYKTGHIEKVPLEDSFNQKNIVDTLTIQNIRLSKKDWDSRETSWDFSSTQLLNQSISIINAFEKWAKIASEDFYNLHSNEEELNRLFIDIYGLNEELNPIVPLKDITILQDELDGKAMEKAAKIISKRRQWKLGDGKWELFVDENKPLPELLIKRDVVMKQLISYAIGCMMGRYRLDEPGLQIAHPNPSPEEVCTYEYNGYPFEIDDDGIIPLMGSNCTFADDAVNRFNHFLEVVWGADTLTQNKNFLADCLNQKTENQEIEKYLVKDFWKDHCQTYKKKPIYWLFASEKGAFQVLVYMHRMNRFTVEKIRSKYLLKHLQYLQQEIGLLKNMSGLSRDEQKRLDTLKTQNDECVPYELLLKDFADRQIEFDLDDGVTINYELFKGVVVPIK